MGETPPVSWRLDDLAATGDLAKEHGVHNSTIVSWSTRYADFPAPLRILSTGPVYSKEQVKRWHDGRTWLPGRPRKPRSVQP
ncbi:hypothetical protein C1I95_32140 [Micromonospora craterilacus]|uniref:DNA-binding protein n=1 Tax=Micromonospora craterilacus TaxID=1655439 RepID=A0A2W2ENF0_9ACTN|nr:hypothetical protein [Micromonospora craterilacus]PZG06284.1 hypothetical protein C1I95_32140 [Micromonospora craterilacus]